MKQILAGAVGALALAFSGVASATTVIGTLNPGSLAGPVISVSSTTLGVNEPGWWEFQISLSEPAEFASLYSYYEAKWYVNSQSGEELEANDYYVDDYVDRTINSNTVKFRFKSLRNERRLQSDGTIFSVYYDPASMQFGFGFDDDSPVNYQITTTRISAVPEPATWATLIAGFGLAGAGLRLARSRRQEPRHLLQAS